MNQLSKRYFKRILTKYRLGKATADEIKFLEAYYDVFELNNDLITAENEKDFVFVRQAVKSSVDKEINKHNKQNKILQPKTLWVKYAVAALILFFITFGILFIIKKDKAGNKVAATTYKGITPGGNKATLTLANGTQIILEDALNGEIARQAGVSISKTASGLLVYKALNNGSSVQHGSQQNSIATPKGGQYKVILPDGTSVWLNAASSITYPTSFTGNERLVSVTGEAYFEVAKNKDKPFKVKSALQTVEVLGTHFNINAYADEAVIKTTLLEGSVKIASSAHSAIISPGEQAVLNKDASITKRQVDTQQEVAWKNGVFSFKGEDIRSVMRQVGRWYNIDVVCESNVSEEKFFGEISRSSRLDDVFKILELNNVKFTVEGKKVTVSYKNNPY
jgi:transmembrane sensor